MQRLNADLALLLAATIWGVAFLFQKSATSHIGPLTFIAARCALAAVALAPFAWHEGRSTSAPAERRFPAIALWGGLAFFIAAWLQQAGLATATVTNTGFLTALYVVIIPLFAWGSSGRVPSAVVWPAIALSALGTWLLGGGTLEAFSGGDRLVALSAVFWAAHVVITARASSLGRPIGFTTAQFAVVAVLATLGATVMESTTIDGFAAAAIDIAYVGLFSSALTFTLLTVALRYTPPAEAAVILSAETIFAALAGYLVLGEQLVGLGWLGAGLILLAILLIQLAPALGTRWR